VNTLKKAGLINRFQVYAWVELTEEQVQIGIYEGTFPKPDFLFFGHQSRWKKSTIRNWLQQQAHQRTYCALTKEPLNVDS
jgi:predicted DNA-binding transcriptional regulator AlpA